MPVCKWRFSALPVLTYIEYAALRCSKTTIFATACRFLIQTLEHLGTYLP